MVSLEELERTTDALISARRVLAEAREQAIEAKEDLKSSECSLILRGLNGKNEKEREAFLRTETFQERQTLLEAEKRERAAILELEICKDIRRCLENIISVELMKEEA